MGEFEGRTVFMSGGSRGIGLAIAEKLASEGANIAFIAKTDTPDPRLPGTIHTAAASIEAAGGNALPILGDIRDEDSVASAVEKTVAQFGGIDICINNASAINLSAPGELPIKRFDLMLNINARGAFAVSQACLPHLRNSDRAHILSLSPPLDSDPKWLATHAPYTLSKFGMSMLTLGFGATEAANGVAANCLWPRTIIATAAVQNLLGGDEAMNRARTPGIIADSAAVILARDPASCTGNTFIDDEVLAEAGITDLSGYRAAPGGELILDVFVDGWGAFGPDGPAV
ncbi:MAG: NAD(P)-dependent oxidoreductase [Solirubrobacterales bacterium]|nr:NAD(P)-dependent oxidoreductase [Solirubrobacterales bacterium]